MMYRQQTQTIQQHQRRDTGNDTSSNERYVRWRRTINRHNNSNRCTDERHGISKRWWHTKRSDRRSNRIHTKSKLQRNVDSLIYQICDANNDCDTALVVITVSSVDDAPIANADNATTTEDTPITMYSSTE
jgi:hypothetical protein